MPTRDPVPQRPLFLLARLRAELLSHPRRLQPLDRAAEVGAVLILLSLVLRQGYHLRGLDAVALTRILGIALFALVAATLALRALALVRLRAYLRRHGLDLALLATLALPVVGFRTVGFVLAVRILLRLGARQLTNPAGREFVLRVRNRPMQIIVVTFLVLIALGTLFLTFPGARPGGTPAPPLTALFTATSAVCVTGLVTVDTAAYWSTFGQVVILCLIQIGGLGIMSLSASAALILGRRLGAGSRGLLAEVVEETATRDVTRLLQFILSFTFAVEAAGAVALGLHWGSALPAGEAWYQALFHAVSAFCNAGFSTFPGNLEHWVGDPLVNGVVAVLIVLGGLGFTVGFALARLARRPHRPAAWWRSLGSHDKLVLIMSAALVVAGTLAIFYLEYEGALVDLSIPRKLLAALFQSVSLRTAGFNTVSIGAMAPATATLMMVWMFIGGSPGGTAGGVKTSTIGILALSLRSLSRGRRDVELYGRRVPDDTLLKAIAVTLLGGAVLVAGTTGLLLAQAGAAYTDVAFEAVSAFGTVGLSRGLTPSLTPAGQLLIIALMFTGRTGPLTLALALGRRRGRTHYRYPEGRILVG